jgi:hypothetical protein
VILDGIGAPPEIIGTIAMHPVRIALYGSWIVSLVWFSYAVIRKRGRDG